MRVNKRGKQRYKDARQSMQRQQQAVTQFIVDSGAAIEAWIESLLKMQVCAHRLLIDAVESALLDAMEEAMKPAIGRLLKEVQCK